MSAHTPGPWTVGGDTQFMNQVEIWPAIGCAYGVGPEVIANAHLIAAAPDLLEALEKIAVLYEKDIDADNYEQAANAYEMRCIARAAIAKAKGETP